MINPIRTDLIIYDFDNGVYITEDKGYKCYFNCNSTELPTR